MRLVFLSNYFNHHQKPISDAFDEMSGVEYAFIETSKMTQERLDLGWGDIIVPDYVYSLICEKEFCIDLINNADVIITGSAPEYLLKTPLEKGTIIFRYSERPIKTSCHFLIKYPVRFIKWHLRNKRRHNIYLLCAGAYVACDYSRFSLFKNRMFKWGYFPRTQKYEDVEAVINEKKRNEILWVSRMIEWKHPEHVIMVAKKLKEENVDFKIKMIGDGKEHETISRLIADYGLEEDVTLIGAVKQSEVRKHMEESSIFIFTSDHNEGWGAVLNEAMNSACAVVANKSIGSVPYLIVNRQNGLIYEDGNVEQLYEHTLFLLKNQKEREQYGYQAYKTVVEEWNAEKAANNFLELCYGIINSQIPQFSRCEVCSFAEIIKCEC